MKVNVRFDTYPDRLGSHVLTGNELATLKVQGSVMSWKTDRTPVALFEVMSKQGIQWWVDFVSITFEG